MGKRYEAGTVLCRQLQELYAEVERTKDFHCEILTALWSEQGWEIEGEKFEFSPAAQSGCFN